MRTLLAAALLGLSGTGLHAEGDGLLRWGERVAVRPVAEGPAPARPRRGRGYGSSLAGDPLADVSRRIVATAESLGWSQDPGAPGSFARWRGAGLKARPDAPGPALRRAAPPNPIRPPAWLGRLAWLLRRWRLLPVAARLIGAL